MTSSPISRRRDSHSDQEDAFEAAPDYHRTIAQALAEAIEKGLEIQDENVTDGNLAVFFLFYCNYNINNRFGASQILKAIKKFCDLICRGISTCG